MTRPTGLVDRLINIDTGEIARPGQANTVFELFMEDLAPAIDTVTCSPNNSSSRSKNECLSTEMIFQTQNSISAKYCLVTLLLLLS